MKIKICFISLGSYPLFNPECKRTFGGAEVQMYLLAKQLSRDLRFDISFIVGDFCQNKIEYYDNIKVIRGMKIQKNNFFSAFFPRNKVRLFYAMIKTNADVYIQRSASAGTGLIRLFTWILRKKFVYMSAHQIDCEGTFEKKNNFLVGQLYRFGIRGADSIISQNEDHKKLIKEYHKRDSIVIHSGYDILLNKRINRQHILWVGRCEDWKNPELFFRLSKKFPKEKFIFISPKANQGDYYDKIFQDINNYKNIIHIEYVPFNKIDEYFKKAKIFINTSEYEGFPNTFVQAAKNSVPIISYKVNPDGFLEKYECGYCAYGNEEKLVDLVKIILANKKEWLKLSKNAFRYANKIHNIKEIIKEFKHIILDLNKNENK